MTSPGAPRLGPGEYIAPYLTRRGRFTRVDPLRPRALPRWPRWVATLGWAALLGGSIYRALRRAADETAPGEAAAVE